MRRTETFRLQHAELAGLADRVEQMLTLRALVPDDMRASLALFARVLTEHAAQEDERLYPMLFQHPSERVRSLARGLHAEFGVIYAAVEVFIAVWCRDGALEAEPERFIGEAAAVLATLRQRIAKENDELYATIDAL